MSTSLCHLTNLSDLIELRELYRLTWPSNYRGFYALDNFLKWYRKDPQIKHVQIYTFNENWRKNGGFLIVDRFQLFVNSLKPAADDVELSETLKQLDWKRGYKITSLSKPYRNTVVNILNGLSINWRDVLLRSYRLSREKALECEVKCPANFEIRPLKLADAETINNLWYSQQAGSRLFLERLIAYNISIGIYKTDSDELVAWCTRSQCGYLGTLHVKEAFRRRGLAVLVIKAFSRKVAETGDDVYTLVNEHNHASNDLFAKLNFDVVEEVYHMKAFCVAEGLEWPADDE